MRKILGLGLLILLCIIGEIRLLFTSLQVGLWILGVFTVLILLGWLLGHSALRLFKYSRKAADEVMNRPADGTPTTRLGKLLALFFDNPLEAVAAISAIGLFRWWWSGRGDRKLKRQIAVYERQIKLLRTSTVLEARLAELKKERKEIRRSKGGTVQTEASGSRRRFRKKRPEQPVAERVERVAETEINPVAIYIGIGLIVIAVLAYVVVKGYIRFKCGLL